MTASKETTQPNKPRTGWHAAFFDAIRAELAEYRTVLHFDREHSLNTEPLRIDALIIKKDPGVVIEKNFAEIFKSSNIVEYKRPKDAITLSSYLKLMSYAGLYQNIEKINPGDITVTLIGSRYPGNIIKALKSKGRAVTEAHPGIYRIEGEWFSAQFIESKKLPTSDNIWLRSLRSGLSAEELNKIADLILGLSPVMDISAYMRVILAENNELLMKGEARMAKSLDKILKEAGFVDRWVAEGKAEGIYEGKKIGIDYTLSIIKGLKNNIPPDRLAREADIPVERVAEIQAVLS